MKVLATISDHMLQHVEDSLFSCGEKGKDWSISEKHNSVQPGGLRDYYIRSKFSETLKEALWKNSVYFTIVEE